MTTFGTRLRAAREAAGLSQDAAALELSITKGAMSAWENDKNYPQLLTFIALCRLYDCAADQLLFGDVSTRVRVAEPTAVYLSQDMKPGDLSMAIQLANEKIATAGLAPTQEQYGQFVLQLYDVLVGGLPLADVHDLRSGKLHHLSPGDRNDAAPEQSASQGQRPTQPVVEHLGKAARKSRK